MENWLKIHRRRSSHGQVLFRLVETHSGGVSIDGVDVRHVPLDVLRSRIAIIPQVRRVKRYNSVNWNRRGN